VQPRESTRKTIENGRKVNENKKDYRLFPFGDGYLEG
jgi:hypothetical protein